MGCVIYYISNIDLQPLWTHDLDNFDLFVVTIVLDFEGILSAVASTSIVDVACIGATCNMSSERHGSQCRHSCSHRDTAAVNSSEESGKGIVVVVIGRV